MAPKSFTLTRGSRAPVPWPTSTRQWDARSDIWFTVHLGLRLKKLYAGSTHPHDQGFNALTWEYIDPMENAEWRLKDEPLAQRMLKEINGFTWADKKLLASFAQLKDDGSTACGA
jgi:formate dehydrogenase major subunit